VVTFLRNVGSYRSHISETPFFIVTAVKTSNLTRHVYIYFVSMDDEGSGIWNINIPERTNNG
jgi:hypothetical protein